MLFGIPAVKDEDGSVACEHDGIVQQAIRAIKKEIKDLFIIADICNCEYTSHGHCGIVNGKKIDNDATIKVLAKIALSHAQAGADFVAPSAMMDGQVKAIRETLDENRFKDVRILAYSAKYASNFYGPFRDALDSAPQFGDRRSYQMDYRNAAEALREIRQDIDEVINKDLHNDYSAPNPSRCFDYGQYTRKFTNLAYATQGCRSRSTPKGVSRLWIPATAARRR